MIFRPFAAAMSMSFHLPGAVVPAHPENLASKMPMMGSACYIQVNQGLGGTARARPIAPVMLFLGESETDEPDTAAREAALDLGQRLDRPVLLLDLGSRALVQYHHFLSADALADRAVPQAPPIGQAALHFHPLRDSNLYVSSLTPGALAPDDSFWERRLTAWPSIRRRLLELFGAVVVAVPSLARSHRGLLLTANVEATILALRESPDVGVRAAQMRDTVERHGGRSVGVVLTGCNTELVEQRTAARRWW